jgi:DNA invertase Pin-like site-specific DNA recombinase
MKVGYARVSSIGQNLETQIEILKNIGCEKIFKEKKSGIDAKREELQKAMDYVREGDTLYVTRLDRFGRNSVDLHNLVKQLEDKGVVFCAIQQNLSTEGSVGKLTFGILATISEFENNIRKERQAEGIANAKRKGVRFGTPPKVTQEQVKEMYELKQSEDCALTNQQIAERYGISRSSLLRLIAKYKKENKI